MASVLEIAERVGVSRRTVLRALNEPDKVSRATRDKVQAVIKELGYTPNMAAISLRAQKRNLKITVFSLRSIASPFHQEINRYSLHKAAELKTYGINVEYVYFDKNRSGFQDELNRRIDALDCDFLISLPMQDDECASSMLRLNRIARERHIPNIFYNQDDPSLCRMCYVGSDYVKAGRVAAGLIGMAAGGNGNIAVLSSGSDKLFSFSQRMEGFRSELAAEYPEIKIVSVQNFFRLPEREIDFEQLSAASIKAVYLFNPGSYSY